MRNESNEQETKLNDGESKTPSEYENTTVAEERWLPVVGYEGHYEVSNRGGVRSLKTGFPRTLATPLNTSGYLVVDLWLKGKRRLRSVHILVLESFVGPRPTGYHACHNDGNRKNAALENLRWDTPEGNAADKALHGTSKRPDSAARVGSLNATAKLNEEQVLSYRKRMSNGESARSLAKEAGVAPSLMKRIRRRLCWTHI